MFFNESEKYLSFVCGFLLTKIQHMYVLTCTKPHIYSSTRFNHRLIDLSFLEGCAHEIALCHNFWVNVTSFFSLFLERRLQGKVEETTM